MMPPKKKARDMDAAVEPEIQIDKTIRQLLQVRAKKEELEASIRPAMAKIKLVEDKLIGKLTAWMDDNDTTSLRTAAGSLSFHTSRSAPAFDPDAFMAFVIEKERYELLERRANALACIDFAEETGKLPPGVKINVKRTLVVKEPGK